MWAGRGIDTHPDAKAHTVIKITERAAFAKVIESQTPSSFQNMGSSQRKKGRISIGSE